MSNFRVVVPPSLRYPSRVQGQLLASVLNVILATETSNKLKISFAQLVATTSAIGGFSPSRSANVFGGV